MRLISINGPRSREQKAALGRITIAVARSIEAGASPEDLVRLFERAGMPAGAASGYVKEVARRMRRYAQPQRQPLQPAAAAALSALGILLMALGYLLASGSPLLSWAAAHFLRITL